MADTDLLVVSRGGVQYKITRGELDAYLKDGYTVVDSMLFNGTNALLQRTGWTADINRKTLTVSHWIKRGKLGTLQEMYGGYDGATVNVTKLYFTANDTLGFNFGGATMLTVETNAVYRDPSAWYHIVLSIDTTQAVDIDRVTLYVNGEELSDFKSSAYPALNQNCQLWLNNQALIGKRTVYYDGYMSEFNYIEGQALTPSDFGETGKFGEWLPKKYTGTYGTNGFYLEALDSADLGKDTSGNGNDWTNTNVVQVTDTPTDNYAVFNPLIPPSARTAISDGNLTVLGTSTIESGNDYGTIGIDNGKWYWETNVIRNSSASAYPILGAVQYLQPNSNGGSTGSAVTKGFGIFSSGGVYKEGSLITTTTSFTAGDIIGIALNIDDLEVTFYKNGNPIYTLTSLAAGTYWSGVSSYANSEASINFGQKDFAYAVPTGFKALSTKNLPDATVVPSKNFGVRLRTGTGVEATVSDLGFQPDLLWTKTRSWDDPLITGINHNLHSTLMAQNYSFLQTNTTDPENSTATNYYMTPTSTGYNVGTGDNINQVNHTFVDWLWKAGTEVTNTDGDITTSVSANTTAGFSIVTFTGTGVITDTIGHGLGTTPEMMFVRGRSVGSGWFTYNKTMGNGKFMYLNTTQAETTSSGVWNNTSPTNTVFVTGSASDGVTMVAYCFASVEGYSKIGSYTGNSSTDGPFVYTGFRPAYVLVKNSTSGGLSWVINDTSRDTYNVCNKDLIADGANAESNPIPGRMDILSNGFKIRSSANSVNQNGNTLIYMAFAEHPFKNANAR